MRNFPLTILLTPRRKPSGLSATLAARTEPDFRLPVTLGDSARHLLTFVTDQCSLRFVANLPPPLLPFVSILEARLVDFQRLFKKVSQRTVTPLPRLPDPPGSRTMDSPGGCIFSFAHARGERERFYPLEGALVKSVPRPRSSCPLSSEGALCVDFH